MTLDTLRWLVLIEAVAVLGLSFVVGWLAWTLHHCLQTVRRLDVPSRPGDIAASAGAAPLRRP